MPTTSSCRILTPWRCRRRSRRTICSGSRWPTMRKRKPGMKTCSGRRSTRMTSWRSPSVRASFVAATTPPPPRITICLRAPAMLEGQIRTGFVLVRAFIGGRPLGALSGAQRKAAQISQALLPPAGLLRPALVGELRAEARRRAENIHDRGVGEALKTFDEALAPRGNDDEKRGDREQNDEEENHREAVSGGKCLPAGAPRPRP